MAFQALNWKKKSRNNSLGNNSWLCTSQVLLLNTVQPWQCSNPVPEPGIFTAHAFGLAFHFLYQDGKRKIMRLCLCRISSFLLALWDPRGHISILNRFSLTWVSSSLLPCPLTSRGITVCWQTLVSLSLRNLARKIVVFDHCKRGNFVFLPPHLARWDGEEILAGIHKNISYLANWLHC